MREQRSWTLIIKDINNKYIRTNHYYSKAEAIEDLRHYTGMGYIVTMLTYGIYINSDKEQLQK